MPQAHCRSTREPPTSAAFELYTKLKQTSNESERAEVIAQAFDALEARFPQISDLAAQGHLRETELRLQKEIRAVEASLQKEILRRSRRACKSASFSSR